MKKALVGLLALVMVAVYGCAGAVDTAAFPATSRELTQHMMDGEFDKVLDAADSTFRRSITAEVLGEQWRMMTDGIGEYGGAEETVENRDGYTTITQVNSFPHIDLRLTYVFNDASGELSGMWLNHVARPVEPQQTDAYTEEAVTVGQGDTALDGMLTLPRQDGPYPAVVLVHGSGPQDMDETIGTAGNKPLADIAHGLAEHGVASVRYNKRTQQYPDATPEAGVTIEYKTLDDAALAYDMLLAREDVDAARVYIVGHSLGGMVAPVLAARLGAAGYASMAGSPRHLADIILDQNMAAMAASGVSALESGAAQTQLQGMVDAAKAAEDGDTVLLGYTGQFWASMNALDIPAVARELDVPAFIAQGTEDFQVFAEKDYAEWQTLLAGRDNVEFMLYDGLNHLFMPSNGKADVSEYNPPAHVERQVIDDLAAFILQSA